MIPQHFWRKPWSCKKMVSPTYPWQRPSRRNKSQSISQRYKPLAQSIQTGIKVLVFLLLIRVHHRTRNSGLPSSLARSFAEPTALTVTEHLAMLPILLQIASNSDSSIGAWLGHFFDHQCTLIESLPFGTQSSSLWGVNSSESLTKWCKTGSRPAFLFGINHFTCLCSRSRRLQIIVGVLEYRCRSYAPH